MFILYLFACSTKSEPINVSEPSSDLETPSEPIIVHEGTWELAPPTLISDVCNVGNFQDVSGFVPPSIGIGSSTEASFLMLPDQLLCTKNAVDFVCSSFSFTEDTGFAAELSIRNDISGYIEDEENIVLRFEVTIESCDGLGCLVIGAALDFPCLIELESEGDFAP